MNLTKRQTAHILAALRRSQSEDLGAMPHFEETTPLTAMEIDDLCEELNMTDGVETSEPEGEGDTHPYTVIGLYPDTEWDGSMHDNSFVCHVDASTPRAAASAARHLVASKRAESWGRMDAETLEREASEYASKIEILSIFAGHVIDLYDPSQEGSLRSEEECRSGEAKTAAAITK